MDDAESRPCHHHDSDESHSDSSPAAGAHPFAEDRPRQGGNKERRRKCDGENLIDGPSGAQQAGTVQWIGHDQGEQEREGVARPNDLEHVDLAAEIFRGRIEERKRARRPAHQRNTDKARAPDRSCGPVSATALRWSDIRHRSLASALSCQWRSTRYDKSDRARKIAIPAIDSRISAANMRGILSR